eukprot:gene11786-14918_t
MIDAYPSHPPAPYGGATMDVPISPDHLELLAGVTASPASNTSDGRFNFDISHVNYSKAFSEESNTSCGNESNFPDPSGNPPHFQNQPKPQHQLLEQKVGGYIQQELCPKQLIRNVNQQQHQDPGPTPAYNPLFLHGSNGGSGPSSAGGRGASPPAYNPLSLHGSNGGSGPSGAGGRGAGGASRMIPTPNGNGNRPAMAMTAVTPPLLAKPLDLAGP